VSGVRQGPVTTTLRGARLADGRSADVEIAGAHIAMVTDHLETATAAPAYELDGHLLLPGFLDGHLHLDKTFLGARWVPHEPAADIEGRIAIERRLRREIGVPVAERARALIDLATSWGTTAMRSHVDVDDEVGLAHVESLLDVRAAVRDRVDIELVAFPQRGVVSCHGVGDLLDEALGLGVDLVGGLDPIGIDHDLEGQLDVLFELAERHGRGIDLHLHDAGEMGWATVREVASRVRAHGMEGLVTLSHAYCLGELHGDRWEKMAEVLREADIAIATASSPGPMPPVDQLLAAGIRVLCGSDNVRDAWSPLGTADVLERLTMIAYRLGLVEDSALVDLAGVISTGRGGSALERLTVTAGAPADLVVVEATSTEEAVAAHAKRLLVLKAGSVVHDQCATEAASRQGL